MNVLAFECYNFRARIFCLILMGDDAMGEPLDVRVTLPDVLLKACDATMGKFQLLPDRGEIANVLTQFG